MTLQLPAIILYDNQVNSTKHVEDNCLIFSKTMNVSLEISYKTYAMKWNEKYIQL